MVYTSLKILLSLSLTVWGSWEKSCHTKSLRTLQCFSLQCICSVFPYIFITMFCSSRSHSCHISFASYFLFVLNFSFCSLLPNDCPEEMENDFFPLLSCHCPSQSFSFCIQGSSGSHSSTLSYMWSFTKTLQVLSPLFDKVFL